MPGLVSCDAMCVAESTACVTGVCVCELLVGVADVCV
jgi:hypothetical protein